MKTKNKLKSEWKNIIFNVIFALATLLITILFYKKILLATLLLIIVSTIGLIKWKSTLTLIIFLLGAFWGPISEMIAIAFGVWQYANPNLFNAPLWLLLVWGNAAAYIYQIALEIKKLGIKK